MYESTTPIAKSSRSWPQNFNKTPPATSDKVWETFGKSQLDVKNKPNFAQQARLIHQPNHGNKTHANMVLLSNPALLPHLACAMRLTMATNHPKAYEISPIARITICMTSLTACKQSICPQINDMYVRLKEIWSG